MLFYDSSSPLPLESGAKPSSSKNSAGTGVDTKNLYKRKALLNDKRSSSYLRVIIATATGIRGKAFLLEELRRYWSRYKERVEWLLSRWWRIACDSTG